MNRPTIMEDMYLLDMEAVAAAAAAVAFAMVKKKRILTIYRKKGRDILWRRFTKTRDGLKCLEESANGYTNDDVRMFRKRRTTMSQKDLAQVLIKLRRGS